MRLNNIRGLVTSVFMLALLSSPAQAAGSHGLSLYGDLKYPATFTHFDYVNPDAPKGGAIKLSAIGTFDNLNPYILKGIAADGLGMTFDTLLSQSADEPFSEYGLLAESVTLAPDRSWVLFDLRQEARFSDDTPVTPEDVIDSLTLLKEKGHPFYRSYYRDVVKAEKTGPRQVKFTFKDGNNRELPLIVGQMPVLAKHDLEKRDFAATTLRPLVGSGPYKIETLDQGRSITYRRIANWWGENLPVNKGRNNFDTITYDYYRDGTVALEALFAGRYDLRMENVAKNWAQAYDAPAVKSGQILKLELPNHNPSGMQAFVMNLRRPLFADSKVRQALAYAFDFEWANKAVAFGAYTRTNSYFAGSELAASGLPSADELKLLEPFRAQLPPEVFTKTYQPPATDGSGNNRANLKQAADLLRAAGWSLQNGKLVKNGKPFRFEILDSNGALERWIQPFVRALERLGIQATYRLVDDAQYQHMIEDFDFDMTIGVFPQSLSPGNEQRDYWTSAKADIKGSRNLAGIKNPAVDALVDKVVAANSRADLLTAARALDRVLLWNHYVIPQWHYSKYRIAAWNKFGRPSTQPLYGSGAIDTWWFDKEKAASLPQTQQRK